MEVSSERCEGVEREKCADQNHLSDLGFDEHGRVNLVFLCMFVRENLNIIHIYTCKYIQYQDICIYIIMYIDMYMYTRAP